MPLSNQSIATGHHLTSLSTSLLQLAGTLPDWALQLQSATLILQELDLGDNMISGACQSHQCHITIACWHVFISLMLICPCLTGSLPVSLSNFAMMTSLSVYNNLLIVSPQLCYHALVASALHRLLSRYM